MTPNGKVIEILVAVGIPYEDETYNSWACPVKIEGLYDELADRHGIDSWQALRWAQKEVVSLLCHFVEKGGKRYIPGENNAATLDAVRAFF